MNKGIDKIIYRMNRMDRRNFDFKDQQRDGNGKHTIAKHFKPGK